MATLQQRRCDLCGGEVPPTEVMGYLILPPGTAGEIAERIQKELEQLHPMIAMTDVSAVQAIHQKHRRGLQWEVCKACIEGLTKWSGENMVKWAALGFHRTPERSE